MITKHSISHTFRHLKDEISIFLQENSIHAKEHVLTMLDQNLPPSQKEALIAMLNGMVGDVLLKRNSRLASPMVFTDLHQVLSYDTAELERQLPVHTSRIVLCIHGWCMADKGWIKKGPDHGQQFVNAGYTPIYLRYNTGNHISLNGEELAFRLEKLLKAWPVEVKELVIIGHSMGGLVTRSACYYAAEHQLDWLGMLRTFVTLGTPHNGAPLARLACWIDEQITVTPQLRFLQKLGEIRSNGSKDLSHGFIRHQSWMEEDTRRLLTDGPNIYVRPALPKHTQCYAVASCLGKNTSDENNRRLGDGLVPVGSALGLAEKSTMALGYKPENQWLVGGISHLNLLYHPVVQAKVKGWVLQNTD